ncbi:hypothetical protein DFJ74DRAFT_673663 [Hyaloraphidium curvatum]|nr:hypothetical protein DFJ74DRAFT_673663 [Hyaloraphidium curvatum]
MRSGSDDWMHRGSIFLLAWSPLSDAARCAGKAIRRKAKSPWCRSPWPVHRPSAFFGRKGTYRCPDRRVRSSKSACEGWGRLESNGRAARHRPAGKPGPGGTPASARLNAPGVAAVARSREG